jgi:hypothetical protein
MGFSTLIDILGSTLVGGMIFLILLRINDSAVENTFINGGEYIIQLNLVEIVQVLEYDFRKIGYCATWSKIPDPSKAIIMADSSSISFLTDVGSNGSVDTLHYYLGPASELSMTSNPNDRLLYRVVNSETPIGANLGVVVFNLTYYNPLGDTIYSPVAQPGEIQNIQIDIKVENTETFTSSVEEGEQIISSAFWRQIRLVARNLRNR